MFVIGRPGSGKSTAIRQLMRLAEGYSTMRVKDYPILLEMFKQEQKQNKEHKQFHQTDYGGFDVLDFNVLDTALEQLEKCVSNPKTSQKHDIIFIEFARNTYEKVFEKFDGALLRNAYFLFIEAELDTCVKRIHKRVSESQKLDHHFVSNHIMSNYYDKDNWSYMMNNFEGKFGIYNHTTVIYNEGPLELLEIAVEKFSEVISLEVIRRREVSFKEASPLESKAFR